MLHRNEAGWTNPKVIAIIAVVFLCGSAFGAAAMREYIHYRFPFPLLMISCITAGVLASIH